MRYKFKPAGRPNASSAARHCVIVKFDSRVISTAEEGKRMEGMVRIRRCE